MQYVKLGRSGLDISPICIGCMGFGDPSRGHPAWSLNETASRAIIRHAIEKGINFFDTANMYSTGGSEEILGKALKDFSNRDAVVIATKPAASMHHGPNALGLSRKAIMTEVDHSLRRLGTDYIDLYQIHRRDQRTPWEETLEALNDVVRMGKVRYLGASSMMAWEFSKALHLQKGNGWARFISMQDNYNLLAREEEREMLPLCADEGVQTIVYSPLARGRLARPLECDDRPQQDRAGRCRAEPGHCGKRPQDHRGRGRHRDTARCKSSADCAGMAALQSGRCRAYRGRTQDSAYRRRPCCPLGHLDG